MSRIALNRPDNSHRAPNTGDGTEFGDTWDSVLSSINSMTSELYAGGGGSVANNLYLPSVASAVNLLSVTPGATGSPVALAPGGSSVGTQVDILVQGIGTGIVAIGGTGTTKASASLQVAAVGTQYNGLLVTPAISGSAPRLTVQGSDTSPNLLVQAKGTGTIGVGGTGTAIAGASLQIASAGTQVNGFLVTPNISGSDPRLSVFGSDSNPNALVQAKGTGTVAVGGTGTTIAGASLQVASVGTQVNGFLVTPTISGSDPLLSVFGSDSNPNALIQAKGTGSVAVGGTGTTIAGASLQIAAVGTQVNGILITPAVTGTHPSVGVFGSDTHLNLILTPKGTGTIKFGSTGPITANGTVAATFTVTSAPTGASTSIQRWLNFIDSTGRAGFVPVF